MDHLEEFQTIWNTWGASAWYNTWGEVIEELRNRVSCFLNIQSKELAFLPSTSTALSVIAECVDYRKRNKVICTELDFPTLAFQWAVKPEVELVVLPSIDGIHIDPQQFADAVDEKTAFIATSHIFYTTGYIQDLETLAGIAHRSGAFLLIDGYQAPGQIPVNLGDSSVDFYTTGSLKWLCGGPGLAYLYVRSELIQEMQPRITSWFAGRDQFNFQLDNFEPHQDSRRFEMGTPALPTIYTAMGGQKCIDEVGIETIYNKNTQLREYLINSLRELGLDLTVAKNPSDRSAIVMIRSEFPESIVASCSDKGVIVDSRPGHVRVSPHFYNTVDDIDHFISCLPT
jgi:selenocysteine lyase/cysteine desulfurase